MSVDYFMGHTCRRGNQLRPEDQKLVLAAYVYRNTVENPRRATGGSTLPPITDQRWLEITDFAVNKDGGLNQRVKECYTNHNEVPEWKIIIDQWACKQREGGQS